MINLEIISGTDRPGSNALRIARYLQKLYAQLDTRANILNLQKFPVQETAGGHYGKELPGLKAFVEPLMDADGVIIVCPEYNGGYPGILKLFIDYLPYPNSLNKKPVCFVGEATGAFGGLRAVEQLQQVTGYRNAYLFPERIFIPHIHKNFDEEEGIRDPFQQELLENQVSNFVQYIKDLQTVQPG